MMHFIQPGKIILELKINISALYAIVHGDGFSVKESAYKDVF